MTFDKPWAIAEATISPEVARLLMFTAAGGAYGVVGPADFKVSAQAVPAGSVVVAPGAGVVLNGSATGQQQAYAVRNPASETVQVAPTSSGGGRSDLVVVRVEDPQYSPWQAPSNPDSASYVFARVIPGVPPSTTSAAQLNLGHSMVALARIDLPSSTGSVTSSMVKDLRVLAQPRSQRELQITAPAPDNALTPETFTQWPAQARPSVAVPPWATHWAVKVDLTGIVHKGGGAQGLLVATIGDTTVRSDSGAVAFDFDAPVSGAERRNLVIAGSGPLNPALRGRTVTLGIDARRQGVSAGNNGYLETAGGNTVTFDVQFTERI